MTYNVKHLNDMINEFGVETTLKGINIEQIEDKELKIICRTIMTSYFILMERISEEIDEKKSEVVG